MAVVTMVRITKRHFPLISTLVLIRVNAEGRVTDLNPIENNLSGEIPRELGNLTSLVRLDIRHNQLTGEIPNELGNLSSLAYLEIQGNRLSGCVPAKLQGQLYMDNSDLGGLPFCQ